MGTDYLRNSPNERSPEFCLCVKRMQEPILQWRKLTGNISRSKDYFGRGFNSNESQASGDEDDNNKKGDANSNCNRMRKSRQDCINEEARKSREQRDAISATTKKVPINITTDKMHLVQCKKAQYSNIISHQKGSITLDDDKCPIVYSNSKTGGGKKSKTALWLQPFTVVAD